MLVCVSVFVVYVFSFDVQPPYLKDSRSFLSLALEEYFLTLRSPTKASPTCCFGFDSCGCVFGIEHSGAGQILSMFFHPVSVCTVTNSSILMF
mmetsp:Transcript_46529/g.53649  ORF Transcript_46529/g.53649 Transcript_46529/m.53649 type:complete len:93 (-) Transcript_46529:61-339(-)